MSNNHGTGVAVNIKHIMVDVPPTESRNTLLHVSVHGQELLSVRMQRINSDLHISMEMASECVTHTLREFFTQEVGK